MAGRGGGEPLEQTSAGNSAALAGHSGKHSTMRAIATGRATLEIHCRRQREGAKLWPGRQGGPQSTRSVAPWSSPSALLRPPSELLLLTFTLWATTPSSETIEKRSLNHAATVEPATSQQRVRARSVDALRLRAQRPLLPGAEPRRQLELWLHGI